MSAKTEAIAFAKDAVESAIDASIKGVERALERRRLRTCERMLYRRKRAVMARTPVARRYWTWLADIATAKCEAMREDAHACYLCEAHASLLRAGEDTAPISV